MNNVILIGRIAKKPELEYTTSNMAVTKFILAVDRGRDKGADFIRITAFDKQAENICRYMDKGRQIAIHGRIQTGSYEKDGKRIYTQDVISDRSEFLGKAEERPVEREKPEEREFNYSYDDMPF